MTTKRDEICIQYAKTEAGFVWQAFFVNRAADSDTCQKLARENKAPLAVYAQTPEIAQAQKPWVENAVKAGALKYLKSWTSKTGSKYAVFVPAS
jgi:hypothetical protein